MVACRSTQLFGHSSRVLTILIQCRLQCSSLGVAVSMLYAFRLYALLSSASPDHALIIIALRSAPTPIHSMGTPRSCSTKST